MGPTATAGGGVMYSNVIRKEDTQAKRIVSPSYNRAARNMSFSKVSVMTPEVTSIGR